MTIMILSLSEIFLSRYYHYQGSNITMHHNTITISNLQYFNESHLLYKIGLPVKIPNITAHSNISFATILIFSFFFFFFATQKSFLFSYFNNLDQTSFRMVFQNLEIIYRDFLIELEFIVCVEVLRPSQPNGVMSSVVSLPNHTFTGQA